MMRWSARLLALVLTLASCTTFAQTADDWPSRPVRLIVPFPAGATTDFMGRLMADWLRTRGPQPVVVENIAGAAGTIGMAAAAKAPADGHHLLVSGGSVAASAHLFKSLPFVPMRDLVPVGALGRIPTVFAVHKDIPATTLAEFVALARRDPGKYNYVTPGPGTPPHVAPLQLTGFYNLDLLHVPYRGMAPAITDLVAGRGHLIGVDVSPILPHIRSGTLRPLAVAADRRIAALPAVPTATEAGFTGYTHYAWWGLFAPSATPPAILDRLNALMRQAVTDPTVKERLLGYHAETIAPTRAEVQALLEADDRTMGEVVAKYGITAQ